MIPGPWIDELDSLDDEQLYPGLSVRNHMVSGSICVHPTRLPVWSPQLRALDLDHYIDDDGAVNDLIGEFLHFLVQQRGEFGRLLLVLADVERAEAAGPSDGKAWWLRKKHRKRVARHLRRCLRALGEES